MAKIKGMHLNIIFILFLITLWLRPLATHADDSVTTKEYLVEKNKVVSHKIDNLARRLDSLLANRRDDPAISNKTTISLLNFLESREGGYLKPRFHIAFNLRLPQLQDKWKLRLSSYDNEDEYEGLGRNRDGAAPRAQKLGTSLGLNKTFANIKTLFRPRIEFKNPLVTSLLLKFNQKISLKNFDIIWTQKFFAHSINGAGESTSVDFEKSITQRVLLRFFNESQYLDQTNIFKAAQGPSLRMELSESMALSNTLSFYSASRTLSGPVTDGSQSNPYFTNSYHLTHYQYLLSFSHQIWKRVFHYQISPYLEFAKTQSFKGQAAIKIRAEIIF